MTAIGRYGRMRRENCSRYEGQIVIEAICLNLLDFWLICGTMSKMQQLQLKCQIGGTEWNKFL